MGDFPPNAIGLLVGEGPGAEEVDQKRVFVGVTGRQLDEELLSCGLLRSKLAICNATLCKPPPVKTEGMMRKAAECCRPAFRAQIQKLSPDTPALALGKWAAFALTGQDRGAMGKRGFVDVNFRIPRDDGDRGTGSKDEGTNRGTGGDHGKDARRTPAAREPDGQLPGGLIITWHPTFSFFRQPYTWGEFTADLKRFKRLIEGKLEPMPSRLIIEPSAKDIARIAKRPFVAVDIETAPDSAAEPWTGKDPTRAQLKTISLGCEDWALAFAWNKTRHLRRPTKKLLEDPTILKVFQNGPYFDLRVLRRYGINVVNFQDTRDMRRCLVSTSRLSLAYLASIYTDFPAWKQDENTEEVDK